MPAVENTARLNKITELSEQAALHTGIEISEVQLKGAGKARLLRIYIDKPGGVTHADCELISQRLGKLLDDEDAMPEEGYTLEVSSPGVERRLTRPRDFERVIGQKIRMLVREPGGGQKRVEGRLSGIEDGVLQLEIAPEESVRVPLEHVQRANLKFEW